MDINFAKSRADIEAMPGDLVAVPKEQLFQMIDRAEVGQNAMRLLSFVAIVAGLGVSDMQVAA